MKLPDPNQFHFKECIIGGDECYLIHPKDMATDWTDENSRFRSCIVRKSDNFVVSQGFRKFVNFGEKPAFEPWDFDKFEARRKLDGSLMIVSKHNGELIVRTRNSVSCEAHSNFHELEFLKEKYPRVFDNYCIKRGTFTLLFEWTTPSNIIVLREHDEPTLTLIGCVDNETAQYESQEILDILSKQLNVGRPEVFEFTSIGECVNAVTDWKGCEGVVIYSPCGQVLKKIKADEYLSLHRMASGMNSLRAVLDVYIASPDHYTSYEDFRKHIELMADYEIAQRNDSYIHQIVDAANESLSEMNSVKEFIKYLDVDKSKSDNARYICESFTGYKQAFAFAYFNGKESIIDNILIRAMKEKLDL